MLAVLQSFGIWGKLERWKSSISVCLMSWMKNFKNRSFWSLVISYSVQQHKPFLDQIVTCDRKWILYENWWWPTQWLDQEDAPEHFPRPDLPPKNVMVTVWWSAACLIHCSFLNPSETITSETITSQQIDEIHPKLQSLQQLTLVNRRGPILLPDNSRPHVTQAALHHVHLTPCQLTVISSGISTTFWKENASTTTRRHKILSKSSLNPKIWIFMLQE